MDHFINFDELTKSQIDQYRDEVALAFPAIIQNSEIVKYSWEKVETYFPDFQRILINENNTIVGIVCTLPFYWEDELSELPMDGWDWLMGKGIDDFEKKQKPNLLGGLQIIINKEYKGKGLSRTFIAEGKRIMATKGLKYFALPIRPTLKHNFPDMSMDDYLEYKENGKIYDPWIRTHLKSGAKLIKVCTNAMNVKGDIQFWESLMNRKINQSGLYKVDGGLNLVKISKEENIGEYSEDNIWIYY